MTNLTSRGGLALLIAAALAACGETPSPPPPRCIEGMSVACACPDGREGAQTCRADGTFSACLCLTPDAGPDTDAPEDRPDVTAPDGGDGGGDLPDASFDVTDGAIDVTPDVAPDVRDAPDVVADVPRDGGARCVSARDCDDRNPCTVDRCTGTCQNAPLADGADCSGGSGSACVAGACVTDAELRFPLRTPACTLWSRVPMQQRYLAPLSNAEGLWVASDEDMAILHRGTSGWGMNRFAPYVPNVGPVGRPGFVAMVAGQGFLAAIGDGSVAGGGPGVSRVLLRRGGRWDDVTDATLRALHLRRAWAAGPTLFVADEAGRVFAYEGSAWRELVGVRGGPGFGAASNLYLIGSMGGGPASFLRFDGARWSVIPTRRVGEIRSVAGPRPDDVYALGDALYHVEGATLRVIEGPQCSAGVGAGLTALLSAPGHLVVTGQCGAEHRAWRRVGAAWAALGPLPTVDRLAVERVSVSEGGELAAARDDRLWTFNGSAWTPVAEDAPALPSGFVAGLSIDEVHTLGLHGGARLVGDRWTPLPAEPRVTVESAWQAPDRALFVTTWGASGAAGVWRYAAGSWTQSLAVVSPSNVVGRASNDVYVAHGFGTDQQVRRWNGSTWETMRGPCLSTPMRPSGPRVVALAGARTVLVSCIDSTSPPTMNYSPYQATWGGSWSVALDASYAARTLQVLSTLAPWASPSGLVGVGPSTLGAPTTYGHLLRTEAGWAPWTLPEPHTGLTGPLDPLVGSTPERVVLRVGNGFARSEATTWTPLSDWLAARAIGGAPWSGGAPPQGWTDGRWVVTPARFGTLDRSGSTVYNDTGAQVGRAGSVVRCDFGS